MPFCNSCGSKVDSNSHFCRVCGNKLAFDTPNVNTQRRTVFEGEIHKCPNCGAVVNSFVGNCPECGVEFRGSSGTDSVSAFYQRYSNAKTNSEKKDIIRTFVIPNTKEDVLEFVILASSNIDEESYTRKYETVSDGISQQEVTEAWMAKLEQAYQKAYIILSGTKEFSQIESLYHKKQKSLKDSKKKWERNERISSLVNNTKNTKDKSERKTNDNKYEDLSFEGPMFRDHLFEDSMLFEDDTFTDLDNRNYKRKSKARKTNVREAKKTYISKEAIAVIGMVLVLALGLGYFSLDSFLNSPERELKKQVKQIEKYIEESEYDKALTEAYSMDDDYSDSWTDTRENLIERIYTLKGEAYSRVKIPDDVVEKKPFNEIEALYKNAGFTNVKTEKVPDLVVGWVHKDGEVIEVLIDGSKYFEKGSYVDKDVEVVIKYHGYKS